MPFRSTDPDPAQTRRPWACAFYDNPSDRVIPTQDPNQGYLQATERYRRIHAAEEAGNRRAMVAVQGMMVGEQEYIHNTAQLMQARDIMITLHLSATHVTPPHESGEGRAQGHQYQERH